MTNVHGVVLLALWPSGSLHSVGPTDLVGWRKRNYIKPIKAHRMQTNAEREAQVTMDCFVCTEAVGT